MLEFGVSFGQRPMYRDTIECVQLAEDVGFAFVGLADAPYLFPDVYATLTAIALGTERIQLGPYLTNPLTRHPSVTASATATLNMISEGRAFLGFARGDSAVRMLGWAPAKFTVYEQAIRDIRSWMNGDPVELEGAPGPVAIPWAKGAGPVPIDLGVFGPRGCRTAGRLADVCTTECAELGTVAWFYGMCQQEAREAGREGVPFEISIATHVSDDIARARERCRWQPEVISNLLWQLIHTYGLDALPPSATKDFEWLAGIEDWLGRHDWSKHAQVDEPHAAIISDEMVDRWTVCGSVQACVDKLREIEKIGVSRFCIYLADPSVEDVQQQIRLFGEKIIPEFC